MSVTLAAIGAGVSLASALGNAIAGSIKNKKAQRELESQKEKNDKYHNNVMLSDYTNRSDVQAVLKKQKELLDAQYNRTAKTNAIAGGTDEAAAMQRDSANQSLSDSMTNIAANAAAYKDAEQARYMQSDAAISQQKANLAQSQANNIAQAAGQGVSAGLNMIGAEIGTPSAPSTASQASPEPRKTITTMDYDAEKAIKKA